MEMKSRSFQPFKTHQMLSCVLFWRAWLIVGLASSSCCEKCGYRVVCYFASWANYRVGDAAFKISDIDPTKCTHLIYPFVGLTEKGEVVSLDEWNDLPNGGGNDGFARFVALKKLSPDTKFMVSIGGWNEGSVTYSNVVGDTELRAKFVQNALNFTLTYGFDGFDVNWEYPAQRNGAAKDVQNFVFFLRELRTAFDEHGLILTAAVAAAESSASLSYDIPAISKSLDFISLMTYDFHGSWDSVTGANSPLYADDLETTEAERKLNINASVHYWLDQGAPAEKLNLGIGFYGRTFTLTDPDDNGIGAPSSGAGKAGPISQEAGILFYYEICETIDNDSWTLAWDEEQRVPYAYLDDQWVSYDNERSIIEKIDFAKELCLGGVMIWTIDEDDFAGKCGEPVPLLNTVNSAICQT